MRKQFLRTTVCACSILVLGIWTSCQKQRDDTSKTEGETPDKSTNATYSIWQDILQDTSTFCLKTEKIDGKSVAFEWLENPKIDYNAIRYYLGEFKLADDIATKTLLDKIALAPESETPFYFHILTDILQKADGAVAEMLPEKTEEFIRTHAYYFAHYLADKTQKGRKEIADLYAQFIKTALSQKNIDLQEWKKTLLSACSKCSQEEKNILEKFCQLME
ncbi:MAG: hypothetical protein NZM38_10575 [Cytophagales bacterium]|nr:hypothetical protein [Cytophagales bacterium]MDW8385199.1 hypothetical protein [Flammeovirgaceae bacterium]